jgi:hypothetical protein
MNVLYFLLIIKSAWQREAADSFSLFAFKPPSPLAPLALPGKGAAEICSDWLPPIVLLFKVFLFTKINTVHKSYSLP